MIFDRFHLGIAAAALISIVPGWTADPIPNRLKNNSIAALRDLPSVPGNTREEMPSQTQTNRPALQVSSHIQTIHGGIQIPALIVATEANRFSFLLPPGWRAQSEVAEKRLRLVHPETDTLITIHVEERTTRDASVTSSEAFKAKLLARHPNGKITDEFLVSALGQSGPALDLEWRTEHNLRQITRFALIPFPGGCLEFALTGEANLGRSRQHDFNRLLLSFRAAPLHGKLEIQSVNPE